jgi:hypothetical protein
MSAGINYEVSNSIQVTVEYYNFSLGLQVLFTLLAANWLCNQFVCLIVFVSVRPQSVIVHGSTCLDPHITFYVVY